MTVRVVLLTLAVAFTGQASRSLPEGVPLGIAADRVVAARATITVLLGSARLTQNARQDSVLLAPRREPLDLLDAALGLADMSKPVSCVGRAKARFLEIRCTPITRPSDQRFHEATSTAQRDALRRALGADVAQGVADPQLRIQAGSTSLTLKWSELERWLREYELPEVASSISPADPGDSVVAVLRFGGDEQVWVSAPDR